MLDDDNTAHNGCFGYLICAVFVVYRGVSWL